MGKAEVKRQALMADAALLLGAMAKKSDADEGPMRLIAAGSYGVVYAVPSSSPFLTHLNHVVGYKIQNSSNLKTNLMLTEAARDEDELIVKMSQVRDVQGDNAYDYFNGFVRENVVHIALYHKFWAGAVGADVVPKFYFSGARQSEDGTMWYITVMEKAPGQTLRALLAQRGDGRLSAKEYVLVERAVVKMWLLGVVHADLHMSNIMFEPNGGIVTVLDFGFAVPLPEDVIRKLRKNCGVLAGADADVVYEGLHPYVASTIKRRMNGIRSFNSDGDLLKRLKGLVRDVGAIHLARQALGSLCAKKSRTS